MGDDSQKNEIANPEPPFRLKTKKGKLWLVLESVSNPNQGDQIGLLFTLDSFAEITEVAHIF
jgi:hypothetical protein